MKKLLQKLFRKTVIRLAEKFSSRPDKQRVFDSLTELHKKILSGDKKKGLIIPLSTATQKFIIFSDQHKGAKNAADDFAVCEKNYVAALDYYFNEDFILSILAMVKSFGKIISSRLKNIINFHLKKRNYLFSKNDL